MSGRRHLAQDPPSPIDDSKFIELTPVASSSLEASRNETSEVNPEDEGFRSWLTVFGAYVMFHP